MNISFVFLVGHLIKIDVFTEMSDCKRMFYWPCSIYSNYGKKISGPKLVSA